MAVFNYKTKGELTLQGKQKIYFCAHPRDYNLYFERIKNDILNTLEAEGNTSCALLYLEDPAAERDEDFFFDLKEMDLFVMPVTYKLLNTPNPALDSDFRFAVNNNITVLPIILEPELDDAFNEKCGNLQYLDTTSKDITAIPYKEKLVDYLSSHLIDNELYEKIRRAFDAYIFLSYRKKDRVYAQELMRLIHKNDFCRDIAIWYDEFLTPGDNFNDSIKAAIEKSELFALAVTPNLVSESNYIMSVEYPMARGASKPIIPAELIKTDLSELSEKYPDIPDCIDAHDDNQLSSSLANALANIAVRENDKDPEHNLFIGLAYLGGIDVEKDFERALSLITSAAEAGLPEAMKKLVSVYSERSGRYKTALIWQKRLTDHLKKIYLKKRDEDSAHRYLKELCYFGELYDYYYFREFTNEEQEEEHGIVKEIYEDVLKAGKSINLRFKKSWSAFYLSKSYINYAKQLNLFDDKVKHGKIQKYYLQAIKIAEKLIKSTNNRSTKRNLGIIYKSYADELSSRFYDEKGYKVINNYYLNATKIFEELADEYDTVSAKYDLAGIYYDMGVWTNDSSDEFFSKHISILQSLAEENGSVDSMKELSFAYRSVAYHKQSSNDLDGAEYYFDEHLRVFEEAVQKNGFEDDYEQLATHCMMAYYTLKKDKYAEKTLKIYDLLISEYPDIDRYKKAREWAEHKIETSKTNDLFQRMMSGW